MAADSLGPERYGRLLRYREDASDGTAIFHSRIPLQIRIRGLAGERLSASDGAPLSAQAVALPGDQRVLHVQAPADGIVRVSLGV